MQVDGVSIDSVSLKTLRRKYIVTKDLIQQGGISDEIVIEEALLDDCSIFISLPKKLMILRSDSKESRNRIFAVLETIAMRNEFKAQQEMESMARVTEVTSSVISTAGGVTDQNSTRNEIAAQDMNKLYNMTIDVVPVNNWDPKFGSKKMFPLIDSGGFGSDAIYEAVRTNPNVATEMKQEAESRNLRTSVFLLREESFTKNDFDSAFSRAERLQCHFFYAAMNRGSFQFVYAAAVKKGFIGSKYLWGTISQAQPLDGFNSTQKNLYYGYFYFGQPAPPNPSAKWFWDGVKIAAFREKYFGDWNVSEVERLLQSQLPEYSMNMYNCFRVMFEGFSQMKSKFGLSSLDQLRSYQTLQNFTAFKDTGARQEDGSKIMLNQFGDRASSFLGISPNESNWKDFIITGDLGESYAFGKSSLDGTKIPPSDDIDVYTIENISEKSPQAYIIRIAQAMAALSIAALIGIGCYQKPPVAELWNTWSWTAVFVVIRRIWLHHHVRKLKQPIGILHILLAILVAIVIDVVVAVVWVPDKQFDANSAPCTLLPRDSPYKYISGAINLVAIIAIFALSVSFKFRPEQYALERNLKTYLFLLASIVVLEFVLIVSPTRTLIEALILNAVPVAQCVFFFISMVFKPKSTSFEKLSKKLTSTVMGNYKVKTCGKFGWGREEKNLIVIWERFHYPQINLISVDGVHVERICLKALRKKHLMTKDVMQEGSLLDVLTLEDSVLDERMILLNLPKVMLIFKAKSVESIERLFAVLDTIATRNEFKAQQELDTMARVNVISKPQLTDEGVWQDQTPSKDSKSGVQSAV
ncbi:hypothetical protein HDU97_007390 [Phlyctochytrium planicorne]|nr:hypothetical protein HDU97_007390 [Phlyctochytrium planicorne]